jgi:HTH-type transcriptional regulator/antitoxin HigA
MGIYPIRNEADHRRALARIEALMDAESLTAEQGDELDALVTLVSAYEDKNFPIRDATPIQVIEFMMDQRGLTRKDLEPMIGSRARVSEVLSGKRSLTLAMIRRLSVELHIPSGLLIGAEASPDLASPSGKKKLSPPEKKKLSLTRDRRNTYGENAKSSRKNIPLGQQLSQRAMRRAANVPLQALRGNVDDDAAVTAELQSRTGNIKKGRARFRKRPDKPLGVVLKRKASTSQNSRKAFG